MIFNFFLILYLCCSTPLIEIDKISAISEVVKFILIKLHILSSDSVMLEFFLIIYLLKLGFISLKDCINIFHSFVLLSRCLHNWINFIFLILSFDKSLIIFFKNSLSEKDLKVWVAFNLFLLFKSIFNFIFSLLSISLLYSSDKKVIASLFILERMLRLYSLSFSSDSVSKSLYVKRFLLSFLFS